MDRLRSKSQTSLSLESFDVLPLSVTKVVFYNVRSLHRHMVDLKKDFTLLSADILAVSGTRLGEADEIDMYFLTGFTTYRFDYPGTAHRPAFGLAIFVKQSILVRNVFRNLIHNIQVLSLEMFSIKKLKASKPKPYSNPLKVKVLGADPHPTIVVTAVTRVMKTSAFAVPEDVELTAKAIANPAPAKIITIHDAKKSPNKSLEEIIRTVQVRGTDVQVRNVRVKDGTEEVMVALWRDQVDGCKVGEFLKFSNLVTNSYMDEVSLSTTQRTKIQPCDAPPSMLTGTIWIFHYGGRRRHISDSWYPHKYGP
uniref:Uncharacterized protein n=1 Tax=Magallana gigas TaxID=29159 RepID=A0A8W8LHI0_MAGGI